MVELRILPEGRSTCWRGDPECLSAKDITALRRYSQEGRVDASLFLEAVDTL